jgi:hypothetical protein
VEDLGQVVARDAQSLRDDTNLEWLVFTVLGQVQDRPEGVFGGGGKQVTAPLAERIVIIVILMLI